MTHYYKNPQTCCADQGMLKPVQNMRVKSPESLIYCAGQCIPLNSMGLVKVKLQNGADHYLSHGDPIPMDVNGFVLMDPATKKLKFVPGAQPPVNNIVCPTQVQELFMPGEVLPENMLGKVNVCLKNGTEECLAAGDIVPVTANGCVLFDEVTRRAKYSAGGKTITENQVISIATDIASDLVDDAVPNDAEIIAIVESVIDQIPDADEPRTDAEIKAIAQACIDTLPADQVRSDAEILALVNSVVSQLTDEVRTDAEIKAIAQACFDDVAADFLAASEINTLISDAIGQIPPDTVRSDAEIKTIAQVCFDQQDTLTMAEIELLIAQAIAGVGGGLNETQINLLIQAAIDDLPADQVRTDAEIKGIAQACIDLLPADQVRTDGEIITLINNIVDQLPADTVRSDAEIKAIAQQCIDDNPDMVRTDEEINNLIQAFIDQLPNVDTPRTDAEIKAIAQQCIDSNPDLVRTDEEINVLINAIVDQLPPDTVRSDTEIKSIAQQCIDDNPDLVRTDAEINALIQAFIDDLPNVDTPRTDAEIKAIAQQCIDDNPDLVRTDAEINALINAIVSQLPPDTVRSDTEIKNIAQQCIDDNPDLVRTDAEINALIEAQLGNLGVTCEQVVDALAPCNSYTRLVFNGQPVTDINGIECRFVAYESPTRCWIKRCYYGITGIQSITLTTQNNGGFTIDWGHAGDATNPQIESGDNTNSIVDHDFGTEPVDACLEISLEDPCDVATLVQLSQTLLENSEPYVPATYE